VSGSEHRPNRRARSAAGRDHTIERCYEVSEATLRALFNALAEQRVSLEHVILKASMVLSGNKAANHAAP
jgi:fructose-bisphosphate aldolase class I